MTQFSITGTPEAERNAREELLRWTSDSLALDIRSVKQVQNGAVFCQLFHALHGDAIDLAQVNFAAQTEYECLANYRLLQKAHREMTRSKFTDWWKIVSDEDKAWELLAAMSKAVQESNALESYCPLEAKADSKGGKLPSPLEPYMIQAPLLPAPGASRKRSLEPEAYYRRNQALSPRAPNGFPLLHGAGPKDEQAAEDLSAGVSDDGGKSNSPDPADLDGKSAGDTSVKRLKNLEGEPLAQRSDSSPAKPGLRQGFSWKLGGPTGSSQPVKAGDGRVQTPVELQDAPASDTAPSNPPARSAFRLPWLKGKAEKPVVHGKADEAPGTQAASKDDEMTATTPGSPNVASPYADSKAEAKISWRLSRPKSLKAKAQGDTVSASTEPAEERASGPTTPKASWKYIWPLSPQKEEPTRAKGTSAAEEGLKGEIQGVDDEKGSGERSPLSSSGKWLFSPAPALQADAASQPQDGAASTQNDCTTLVPANAAPKGMGGPALLPKRVPKPSQPGTAQAAGLTPAGTDATPRAGPVSRGLFSSLSWQWPRRAGSNDSAGKDAAAAATKRPQRVMVIKVGPGGIQTQELQDMPELPFAKTATAEAGTQTELVVESSKGLYRILDLPGKGAAQGPSPSQGRIVAPDEDEELGRSEGQQSTPKSGSSWWSWRKKTAPVLRGNEEMVEAETASPAFIQVRSGSVTRIPQNILQAEFQDEPPEEPAYALLPVIPKTMKSFQVASPLNAEVPKTLTPLPLEALHFQPPTPDQTTKQPEAGKDLSPVPALMPAAVYESQPGAGTEPKESEGKLETGRSRQPDARRESPLPRRPEEGRSLAIDRNGISSAAVGHEALSAAHPDAQAVDENRSSENAPRPAVLKENTQKQEPSAAAASESASAEVEADGLDRAAPDAEREPQGEVMATKQSVASTKPLPEELNKYKAMEDASRPEAPAWRKDTDDAAEWAGVDSTSTEGDEILPSSERKEAFPPELDTREAPTKVEAEPALWTKNGSGAQPLKSTKPELQAVGVGGYWMGRDTPAESRKGASHASKEASEDLAVGPSAEHLPSSGVGNDVTPRPAIKAIEQSSASNSHQHKEKGKESAEHSSMATALGFWRQKEAPAVPENPAALSQRPSLRSIKKVSFKLHDEPVSDPERRSCENSLFKPDSPLPKKGSAEPRASSHAETSAAAEIPPQLQNGPGPDSAETQTGRTGEDPGLKTAGQEPQKKAGPAARSFWARLAEGRESKQAPQKSQNGIDGTASSAERKAASQGSSGLPAPKADSNADPKAEAEADVEAAEPQRPKALSRLVSERMSNADQLIGKKGVSSKLNSIRERYSGNPLASAQADCPAPNTNRRISEKQVEEPAQESLTSGVSSTTAPKQDAGHQMFAFRRPRRPATGPPASARDSSSPAAPVSPFSTAVLQRNQPLQTAKAAEPTAALALATTSGASSQADAAEASSGSPKASPGAVYSSGAALKGALLKQLSSERRSDSSTPSKPLSAFSSGTFSAQSSSFLTNPRPESAAVDTPSLEAPVLQSSNTDPAEQRNHDAQEQEPPEASSAIVFSTAPALKAALLKQLSGDERKEGSGRSGTDFSTPQEGKEAQQIIGNGSALNSASLRRPSTNSNSSSHETPETPSEARHPVVPRKRFTTARSHEPSKTAPRVQEAAASPPAAAYAGIGRYETAASLKNALVHRASADQLPAVQEQATAEASNGVGRFATGSALKSALLARRSEHGTGTDNSENSSSRTAKKAEDNPIYSAMNRAMERRASLRRAGSFRPVTAEDRSRVRAPPREENLAVRSIIKDSLDATSLDTPSSHLEARPGVASSPAAVAAGVYNPQSLRERYDVQPTQSARKLSVRVPKSDDVAKSDLSLTGLSRASESVTASMKKSALKSRLWAFGKNRVAAA